MSQGAPAQVATSTFTALVLAGSRGPGDPLAQAAGVSHKCMVPVAGVPMLARVVAALADSPSICAIAVVIEDPALTASLGGLRALAETGRLSTIQAAATPSLSVAAAVEALQHPFPLLVTTADHALLTPALIEAFCREALSSRADIVAGLAPASVIQAAYPNTHRTYLRFREDSYSGANLFALLTPESLHAVAFWRRIERERKRPWRLAKAFGLGNLLSYLLRRYSMRQAVERISRPLGCRAEAIVLPIAEAAIDVDKPSDLVLVEDILSKRESPVGKDPYRARA